MKIEKDRVVRFHYSVAEQGQPSLESSQGNDPLAILIGHGNIIPGLERAMEGHEAGDQFTVDVAAADAYGDKRDNLTQRVPKKHFNGQRLEPGMLGAIAVDDQIPDHEPIRVRTLRRLAVAVDQAQRTRRRRRLRGCRREG